MKTFGHRKSRFEVSDDSSAREEEVDFENEFVGRVLGLLLWLCLTSRRTFSIFIFPFSVVKMEETEEFELKVPSSFT